MTFAITFSLSVVAVGLVIALCCAATLLIDAMEKKP